MIKVYKFGTEWYKVDTLYNVIFDKVSKDFNKPNEIEFKRFDIEEYPDLVKKYSIKFVPMTIIEVNDEIKFRKKGILSKEDLTTEVNLAYHHL